MAGGRGASDSLSARLAAKRPFAGYWEYYLDTALFTAPAHPRWGGAACIGPDGSLIGNDVKGSIHQVGAALEGAPSCNGWTYWHFRREGKMIPIDILRQQIRAEMEGEEGRPH